MLSTADMAKSTWQFLWNPASSICKEKMENCKNKHSNLFAPTLNYRAAKAAETKFYKSGAVIISDRCGLVLDQ